MSAEDDKLSSEEIGKRRDAAIRRALNTPPSRTKELIGKTERAQDMAKSRIKKVRQAKSKSP